MPRLLDLYEREGSLPDAVTSHYGDGGLCAALIEERAGIPFSFTAHSLGAQKMDKMGIPRQDIAGWTPATTSPAASWPNASR